MRLGIAQSLLSVFFLTELWSGQKSNDACHLQWPATFRRRHCPKSDKTCLPSSLRQAVAHAFLEPRRKGYSLRAQSVQNP